jgi:bacterial leucyl aminopeptidase
MRCAAKLAVTITLVGCAGIGSTGTTDETVETGRRWITIDNDAVETVRALGVQNGAFIEPVEVANDIAILAFDAEDFRALSKAMHEGHHRCGGFMIHDSLDQARAGTRAGSADHALRLAVDYSIDNAATVNAILPELDAISILDRIRELSNFHSRYYQSFTGIQASNALAGQWRGYAAHRNDVTVEQVAHGWPQKSVILTIPGSKFPDEVVVLGGHLDSIAFGDDERAPGADDDASGIATLSETIRVLLASNYMPHRTVKFMAYAAEEVGLRGSQAIVEDFKTRGVNVVGVMQLDMTNYKGSDKDVWLMDDYTSAAQNTFITQLIDTYLPGTTWAMSRCGYGCSDHASWHREGFPASIPFESRMGEYNPTIHSDDDTLEISENNAVHALKFAKIATAYTIELAKGTRGRPR